MSKRRGILDKNKEEVILMLEEGKTKEEIGLLFHVGGTAINQFIKKHDLNIKYEKECESEGCNIKFTTTIVNRKYCCRK